MAPPRRCAWVTTDPLYVAYHDLEWGVPVHDDRKLFEMLILEGAQAGLSWITVLKRRTGYRQAFADFDPERVASFSEADILRLLQDPGIIRNRLKVRSAVANARALLALQREAGSLDRFLWHPTANRPRQNRWKSLSEVPSSTPESDHLSRELKKRGFSLVGPTTCYAFMQAVGLVNDHTTDCFRHRELRG